MIETCSFNANFGSVTLSFRTALRPLALCMSPQAADGIFAGINTPHPAESHVPVCDLVLLVIDPLVTQEGTVTWLLRTVFHLVTGCGGIPVLPALFH